MNAQELAQKFRGKVAAAASELERQEGVAADHSGNRLDDVPHIKIALAERVVPSSTSLSSISARTNFLSRYKSTSTTSRWASPSKLVMERPQL
jgi:hypothetical protein